ncbi:MAG: pyridoxamine 5'-phosphate oxidase family protein [Desulfobacteraceae bacterium]|jgi:hypothetical protein
MDRKALMMLFNKHPRVGTLSTSNKMGDVNVAVFGSPRMVDENTVVMGIGNNRSFRNLERNPKAVFIVMEPGETPADWKGARVYLEAVDMETSGEFHEEIKRNLAKQWGQEQAEMVHAAIRFRITEVRPIVDRS